MSIRFNFIKEATLSALFFCQKKKSALFFGILYSNIDILFSS